MFLLHLKQLALLRTHTALCQDMLPTEQCKLKRAIFPPPEARRKHAAWRCFFPLGCVLIRISGFVGEFFFKERVFQLSCRIFFWVSSIVKRNIRSIYIYSIYLYQKVLPNRSTCWDATPPGNKWRFCTGRSTCFKGDIPGGPTTRPFQEWDNEIHPNTTRWTENMRNAWLIFGGTCWCENVYIASRNDFCWWTFWSNMV